MQLKSPFVLGLSLRRCVIECCYLLLQVYEQNQCLNRSSFVWNAHTNKGGAITAYYKGKDLSLDSVSGAICSRTPTKYPKCVLSAAL